MIEQKTYPRISDYLTEDWPAGIPSYTLKAVVKHEVRVSPFSPSIDFISWAHELDRKSQTIVVNETALLNVVSMGVPLHTATRIYEQVEDGDESFELLAQSVDQMLLAEAE